MRDPDVGPDVTNGIFSFPGTQPPEREVYLNADVQTLIQAEFGVDVPHTFTQQSVTNHHDFTKVLASETSTPPGYLATIAIRRYLDSIGQAAYQGVVAGVQARLP